MSENELPQIAPRVSVMPPSGPEILRQAAEQRKSEGEIIERMASGGRRQSETLGKLALALSQAQGEMANALRDSTNPHFKSRFASLAAVRDACGPALSKHEIAYIQPVKAYGRIVMVTTLLVHSSGEFIEETLILFAADEKPQTVGSATTYGRRYGLSAMVGVAPADDDGEEASRTLDRGIRNDPANTPLQRAVGRTQSPSDELGEERRLDPVAPLGQVSGGGSPSVGSAGTVPPPTARPLAQAVRSSVPPPVGKPPMRAPGALQRPEGSTDK